MTNVFQRGSNHQPVNLVQKIWLMSWVLQSLCDTNLQVNRQKLWLSIMKYMKLPVSPSTLYESHMLHGAGMFTTIYPIFMTQFCRSIFQHHGASGIPSGNLTYSHDSNHHVQWKTTSTISTGQSPKVMWFNLPEGQHTHMECSNEKWWFAIVTGWWFQTLWTILINWDDSSQYMEK